tara:strand:- start:1252 stop:1773 length:522 start_codon:yes stop_codon:yes gene_type:complete
MNHDTPETWKDKKRSELISEQMEIAYELARISIQIKELRDEPAVPEGSIPLSMIEPLINETVERLRLLSNSQKPKKPKRITSDLILDEIGCPHLMIEQRWHPEKMAAAHRRYYQFVYLDEDAVSGGVKSKIERVYVPRLNRMTLGQWAAVGKKFVKEVESGKRKDTEWTTTAT